MMTTNAQNPLRSLREGICPSRATFCRRYRVGYGAVFLAETGLTDNPANFVSVLARLSNTPAEVLLSQYADWRKLEQAAS